MSSFGSLSPLTIPFRFRRKSSSASTSASMDYHMYSPGDAAPSSSPLLPSSPLLTPLHLTRRYECAEWQASDYSDGSNEAICDPRDKVSDATHPTTRPEHSLPYIHRPPPFSVTKFAAHTLRSDASPPYSPPPFSSPPQTTCFYPQGDSAIADDCEEYDLESMDIHIRETYFATSAERGRWLSSPVASRVRSQATPPMRGHSSPVKTLADASPLRHNRSRSVDKQISTSSEEDRDEDLRYSSSLPPSSPLISPMSNFSFLPDECEDVDPQSNSDDYHRCTGTPELRNPSTVCTSPVESTHAPTPHDAPVIVSALHSTDSPCHSPGSVISRDMNPCSSHSPSPSDVHAHGPGATSFELDDILSPLSQFESDLVEAEPSKLPLSDTVNRPHPGQHTASLGVTVEAARSQDGFSCIQSLSMDSIHQTLDFSLDTVGGSSSNKRAKKRRKSATGNPGARGTKKRVVIRSVSPPSDAKKRRGARSHSPKHSEPPSKKSRLSHCKNDCSGIPKDERLSRSPSRPVVEGCDSESACPRHRKTPKLTDHAQLQQPTPGTPTTPVPMNAVDVEFHASLTGMLVEALATSRATSMDSAALYPVLTQAHPFLAAERSKGELLIDIAAVLEGGRARCGMFEKVDSSGERSRHKALESRWFYVPERDEDQERASLISAIMPRQKRTETKKYKQYYYQPLDKISRWDPEDAP